MENDSELDVEGCVTIEGQRICGDNLSVSEIAEAAETLPAAEAADAPEPSAGLRNHAGASRQ